MKPVSGNVWLALCGNKFQSQRLALSECKCRVIFRVQGAEVALLQERVEQRMAGIMKMKTRTAAVAFTLCLVSSLALADNPSDAPLVTDNAGSAVVQQDERAGCADQHRNKKVSWSQKMARNSSKSEPKKAPRTPEVSR
jgi:hypothetical protein